MIAKKIHVIGAKILVMGLTFKENCPDLRNTRVIDIIQELEGYGATIEVYDPWVDTEEAQQMYKIKMVEQPEKYDAVILAVSHKQFIEMGVEAIQDLTKTNGVIYDIKSILPTDIVDERL